MNDATQFFDTTAAGGYAIERSLRFNSSDSAYLSRTPAGVGTSLTTMTISMWAKITGLSTENYLFVAGNDSSDYFVVSTNTSNQIRIFTGENGSTNLNLANTVAVFRDPSAWYHLLIQLDWSNVTATDRIKLYVNGERVTLSGSFASQGYTGTRLNRAFPHYIGRHMTGAVYFNGYLADIHFIDGQALTPSSFTETDATTGQLIPKAYSGTYGTNGFHLPFSDNSTAAALGTDTSGNSNTWTVNNISVAAGAANDSLVDTPTSYGTDTGAGGEVRGNYATWNPLVVTGTDTFGGANGNLDSTGGSRFCSSTIGVSSGKWYAEITIGNSDVTTGIWRPPFVSSSAPANQKNYRYYGVDGKVYSEAGATATSYNSYTSGDVIGIALDLDNGKLFFAKNGTWQGSSVPASGTNPAVTGLSGTWVFGVNHTTSATHSANFGQRPFAYPAPSGYKALCTTNLPDPVVAQPSTVMDVKLYTGNDGTQTISGLGFSPDLVWIKARSNSFYHRLYDTIRGTTKALYSNTTETEGLYQGDYENFTAFNSDGFSLGSTSLENGINKNGSTFVAWTWDAGSSTVTNTQGSITSQVRANASAGFSIVTYTGNGTAGATVGHGLGVPPHFVITKSRNLGGGNFAWGVFHKSLSGTKALKLNATEAATTASQYWNNTDPSSTVFTIGNLDETNNGSATYVAYCFAPVAGYSSFGSYTGNGSSDGPFVYTGFRPRWVMVKATAGVTEWVIFDTSRLGYNARNAVLLPSNAAAEQDLERIDILSNGFKLRAADATMNPSGVNIIYAAFAESPFQYARAR